MSLVSHRWEWTDTPPAPCMPISYLYLHQMLEGSSRPLNTRRAVMVVAGDRPSVTVERWFLPDTALFAAPEWKLAGGVLLSRDFPPGTTTGEMRYAVHRLVHDAYAAAQAAAILACSSDLHMATDI